MKKIPLAKPDITQKEIDAVTDVLKSGILSIGPKVEEFEKMIADYIGVKHAIAVNSGTSGLHLIIKSLGIGTGDEVITTPFSFIASANCILFEGATPVFVDIDEKTLNIDIDKIEEKITEKTKAILVVDVFGHPVDIDRVNEIARKYNLKVIEDSCEALGSEYKGIKCGENCHAGVFAFYPNKQITTGEGGIIVTDDDNMAKLCKSYRSQGRAITGTWLYHKRLGYNYRLSELHATLGVVQMERIEEILKKRKRVANTYNQLLKNVEGVTIPYIDEDVNSMSWFVYVIRLGENIDRNSVMKELENRGVGCKPYFTPIHVQPFYKDKLKEKFEVTEKVATQTIALPFYTGMKKEEIEYVVEQLSDVLKKYKV
ncbi:MAG: DegT/DnrJ/EryC1/StrS family aminotransferase [Anaeromicrobium sp.]|jgi:perosamine synthetase|uniref:DegT/DnrJ/EryC1/StrS family aminotransferase n=1 Tax=Anaeromicrobium sp. TaxID=1929132 RepID=UPI0025F21514|nr:DegT/DnrJ/EryC1/StrS family aminotransferase [Anaeromicrobium sp.]MCT4593954.1 DegT/DnrJ/EryC1/StrS family aminotransferase [Anaeromicrobium sp.]